MYWNKPLTAEDTEYNKLISATISGVERTFAVYKKHYGLAKNRFLGMSENKDFYEFVTVAHNIQNACNFVSKYGLIKNCFSSISPSKFRNLASK